MKPICPLRTNRPTAVDNEFRTHETDRVARGDFSERIVERRLAKLKKHGIIRGFRRHDFRGTGFLIKTLAGRWLPIQVKTSMGGAFHHRLRYGDSIPVVVTNQHSVRAQLLEILCAAGAL